MGAPLSRSSFWIVTALAAGRKHGYEILHDVNETSGADFLKVTTLYAALERLEREGLIAADGEEIVNGRARRYFRLTDPGQQSLAAEVDALEAQTQIARSRLAERAARGATGLAEPGMAFA